MAKPCLAKEAREHSITGALVGKAMAWLPLPLFLVQQVMERLPTEALLAAPQLPLR